VKVEFVGHKPHVCDAETTARAHVCAYFLSNPYQVLYAWLQTFITYSHRTEGESRRPTRIMKEETFCFALASGKALLTVGYFSKMDYSTKIHSSD
jgi:hypothetical protein